MSRQFVWGVVVGLAGTWAFHELRPSPTWPCRATATRPWPH